MKEERSLQELIDTYLSEDKVREYDKSVISFRNKRNDTRRLRRKRRQWVMLFDLVLLLIAALMVIIAARG